MRAGDEAIAASDDGLDDPFAQDLPQIVHVRPQQALAHRDPAPHGFDDLVVRDQAVRMQHEVTQNRERFAAEAQLLAISPKTLVTEIELKWWE